MGVMGGGGVSGSEGPAAVLSGDEAVGTIGDWGFLERRERRARLGAVDDAGLGLTPPPTSSKMLPRSLP
jgi:hypothetical protein